MRRDSVRGSLWLKATIAALLGALVATVRADFSSAKAAFERKEYLAASAEFEQLAKQGDAEAAAYVGWMYENGLGLPRDAAEAVAWYQKAANLGSAAGQVSLADMLAAGRGVAMDKAQAAIWYRKAAEQGDMLAQYKLGNSYFNSTGVPKDDTQAFLWLRKAAEQGYASAQSNLGYMYSHGLGAPKDDGEAVVWYRRAAEQGDDAGQLNLGQMYFSGTGVPKDYAQAAFWYRKAAEQGVALAQVNLGVAFVKGLGVPKDEEQAYFWWLLASAQGNEDAARKRDFVEQTLTPAQRAEAQAAARAWKPRTSGEMADAQRAPSPEGRAIAETTGSSEAPDFTGTAFRVSATQYITNFHVVQGCRQLRIDGNRDVRKQVHDHRNDLSLLTLPSTTAPSARIRVSRVRIGETVVAAGFPLQGVLSGFNATTGTMSGLSGLGADSRFVQITAPVQPGNSGGPLLDASGNVMGVVESKLDAVKVAQATGDIPQNVNFAINANTLQAFLEANGVDFKTAPLGSVLPTTEIATRAKGFTVLVECWK